MAHTQQAVSQPMVDLCVFIGRFRPFHNGHLFVVREALKRATFLNIVIGSANEPRSVRNPFTTTDVVEMIYGALAPEEWDRVTFSTIEDAHNDEIWIKSVQEQVNVAVEMRRLRMPKIALIGYRKDFSSYYIDLFPQWASITVPPHQELSATQIRDVYFGDDRDAFFSFIADKAPLSTIDWLDQFSLTDFYADLVKEVEFVRRYKDGYAKLDDAGKPVPRYPPVFVSVDAVVIQSGHVLVIRRGDYPGRGLMALPGGYIDQNERLNDAWVRELKEETRIKVPDRVLRGSVIDTQVFDDPHRDARGRMITHATLVHLPRGPLPKIKGASDASSAMWVPLADLHRKDFYADHFSIIQTMIAKLGE